MSALALALVLAAAFVHATWNYILKRSGGGTLFVWWFAALSAVLYAPLALAVVWWVAPEIRWMHFGLMLASAVLHTGYYMLLDRGYRYGDLSLVYPLARGSGPLIAVLCAVAGTTAADDAGEIQVLPVQGNVSVLATSGGNTTVQIGSEGPLVVDAQPAGLSEKVIEAVRRLSPRPIRHVVLTSGGDQQAGGAARLSKAGRYVRVIDTIDPRGAATLADRITANAELLDALAPLVGLLARDRAA